MVRRGVVTGPKTQEDPAGRAGPRLMLVAFVAAQAAVPAALLLHRVTTGVVEWYGWGWQMYSL